VPGQLSLDDLLREVLSAPDAAALAAATARLMASPDVLPEIARKLMSTTWEERALALHFVTRLAPPPEIFTSGTIHCLRSPLDPDPLGDETALVLVCCGLLADGVQGFRDDVRNRVRAIDAAEGPRAPVMRRLAHETLAKIDHAVVHSKQVWAALIDSLVQVVRAGHRDAAIAEVERQCKDDWYPELARATRWENIGDALASSDHALARYCYDQAYDNFVQHASGASSGGEGMARMEDVHRLGRKRGGV
jgi:hypothetical protein